MTTNLQQKTLKSLSLGASVALGAFMVSALPASAANLTSASLSGQTTPVTDYNIYELINPTQVMVNNSASLLTILQGNCPPGAPTACTPAGSPQGNIDIGTFVQSLPLATFNTTTNRTNLNLGYNDSTQLKLSSLTGSDWFTPFGGGPINISFGANNLANQWFNALLASNGGAVQTAITNAMLTNTQAFNAFVAQGGFQRISNPNISYANKVNGEIQIGLAGSDGGALNPLFTGVKVSEVVAAMVNGGQNQFLYGFDNIASASGLSDKTVPTSFTVNYQVKVPEPSSTLGLVGFAGGLLALKRRKKNSGE